MARQKSSRIFDSAHQEAYLRIWRLHDRLSMLEEELFSSHGITSQQYNTLRLLQARHPETMPTLQIARRLISHAPDITRLLDRLEKNALIHRARSTTSRRVVEVGITPAGLDLLSAYCTLVDAEPTDFKVIKKWAREHKVITDRREQAGPTKTVIHAVS